MRGQQPVLVLLPGLQGRHEWLAPAVAELGRWFEVQTFSLTEDAGLNHPDPFGAWATRIDTVLDRFPGVPAVVAGHSFGGLVALHYAASRPERLLALVLASAPAPGMALDPRQARYVRHPYLTFPLFAIHAAFRLAPEMFAARPTWAGRLGVVAAQCRRALSAPVPPGRMAGWVRAWKARSFEAECHRVSVPTLVLTGDPALDRVVPVESSRQYLHLIQGARHVVVPGTGHLGLLTHPDAWSAALAAFVDGCVCGAPAGDNRRMVAEGNACARND